MVTREGFSPSDDNDDEHLPVFMSILGHDGQSGDVFSKSGELEKLQDVLRDMYLKYIMKRQIRSNELSDAVWLLSRSMCKENPGNKTTQIGDYAARSTLLVTVRPDFESTVDHNRYEKSCRRCRIAKWCKWNVPALYYYRLGRIEIKGRRQESPVMTFSLDL